MFCSSPASAAGQASVAGPAQPLAVLLNPPPHGIYAITQGLAHFADSTPDSILADSAIDGLALHFRWGDIEKSRDSYDWKFFDSEIGRAVAAHKHFTISLLAGEFTPAWLFSEGALGVPVLIIHNFGNQFEGPPTTATVPLPWDSNFQARYKDFIVAAAAEIHAHPGWSDWLSAVKICGINEDTQETRVAAIRPDASHPLIEDDVAVWQVAGYRPSKMIAAWNFLLSAYATAFPAQFLNIEIIGDAAAFPFIDENGAIQQPSNNGLTSQIVQASLLTYGSRMIVQYDHLNATGGFQPEQATAHLQGAHVGSQVEEVVFGPSAPTLGSDASLTQAMDVAVANHADFVEVFSGTVGSYPHAIPYGHQKLAAIVHRRAVKPGR